MIKLQRFIDKYIGAVVILFLSILKLFEGEHKKKKRFLLIKLWAIGDSVISLVLVKAIKKMYKNAAVDVLCRDQNKVVFECYDNVDNIYSMDSGFLNFLSNNLRKYDVVFDTEPYFNLSAIYAFIIGKKRIGFSDQFRSRLYNNRIKFRKDQHMVQNYLDMVRSLGKRYDTKALEKLEPPEMSKKKAKEYFNKHKIKKAVGISVGVGGSAKNRMWYEDRFAELADKIIKEKKIEVIFIDSPANDPIVQSILGYMKETPFVVTRNYGLKEKIAMISICDAFISNDSGLMHVAAAQGCRTLGLFGPNTPILWAPYGKNNKSVYKTKLQPSIDNQKGIFKDTSREQYMGVISVDDVFKELNHLIFK